MQMTVIMSIRPACIRVHLWIVLVDIDGESSCKGGPGKVWQHQVGSPWINLVKLDDGCCQHSQQGYMHTKHALLLVAKSLLALAAIHWKVLDKSASQRSQGRLMHA